MGESGGSVAQIITDALKADKVPHQVASLVVGAMPVTSEEAASPPAGSKRAYLKAITVEGFRGIGPKITLTLQPGPGLTVVTGRNGSGKSNFAEAAELALTGENKRWSDQTAVWKEGWRNLHAPDTSAITVQLTEDGEPGTTTVTREWAARAALDDAQARVQTADIPQPLAAKGWTKPLELYRPFLSYSELGALVSGQPSKMRADGDRRNRIPRESVREHVVEETRVDSVGVGLAQRTSDRLEMCGESHDPSNVKKGEHHGVRGQNRHVLLHDVPAAPPARRSLRADTGCGYRNSGADTPLIDARQRRHPLSAHRQESQHGGNGENRDDDPELKRIERRRHHRALRVTP